MDMRATVVSADSTKFATFTSFRSRRADPGAGMMQSDRFGQNELGSGRARDAKSVISTVRAGKRDGAVAKKAGRGSNDTIEWCEKLHQGVVEIYAWPKNVTMRTLSHKDIDRTRSLL